MQATLWKGTREARSRRWWAWLVVLSLTTVLLGGGPGRGHAQRPTLYWGTSGDDVSLLQWRLQSWGYYGGPITGYFGPQTSQAVKYFQWKNGLPVTGIVAELTWTALGLWTGAAANTAAYSASQDNDLNLLAHAAHGEAGAEPYEGQVAVAAVILNRTRSGKFPSTVAGVIYEPDAFESVTNGYFYSDPDDQSWKAARDALNGWDPSYGSLFFWNPAKVGAGAWVWTRQIVTQIGKHVFAR